MLRLRTCTATLVWIMAGTSLCVAQSEPTAGPNSRGWRSFTIAKPPQEKVSATAGSDLQARIQDRIQLPPQKDSLRATLGVGHVLRRDWGFEVGTAGRIFGLQTDLTSFLTLGPSGIEVPSGRLSVLQPDAGWHAEAGDVISELRGLARGARFGWRMGAWHRPSLSVYLPSSQLHDTATIVGFRDEIRLFSRIVAGGEFTSDGSHFLRAGYVSRRFDVLASYRHVKGDDPAKDAGVMASYILPGDIMIAAGLRTFTTDIDDGASRVFSIRLPIANLLAVTLEDTRNLGRESDDSSNAVGVQLLRGRLQLTQRYQWGEAEYRRAGDAFGIEQRQLQTSASFSPARWVSFSPQTVTQWLPDGRAQQWQELQSEIRLSRAARLQLHTSLPRVADPTRFRSRYTHDLPRDLTLVMDYGRVSPFQGGHIADAAGAPRFSVMLRKRWQVATPAYGGTVSGRVVDQRGVAVAGAGVRLGSYLTVTDASGRYLFPRVPSGDYDLRVASDLLPSRYSSDGTSERVLVRGAGRSAFDLTVIPLDAVHGRVYLDSNGNGRYDAGEGRRGIAVHLSDRVTATGADGGYAFHNLAPGKYRIRVDQQRLPDTLAVLEGDREIALQPDRASTGIDFLLVEKDKPILLRRLGK